MENIKVRIFDTRDNSMSPVMDIYNLFGFEMPNNTFMKLDDLHFMVSTGLQDTDGTEAFVGDVVEMGEIPFEVGQNYKILAQMQSHGFKILGNKYQNPELLK